MRESVIETYFAEKCNASPDVMCFKLLSSFIKGLPDRIILRKGGRCSFAEMKAPNKKPNAAQKYIHAKLRHLGFQVYVIDSIESANEALDDLQI